MPLPPDRPLCSPQAGLIKKHHGKGLSEQICTPRGSVCEEGGAALLKTLMEADGG